MTPVPAMRALVLSGTIGALACNPDPGGPAECEPFEPASFHTTLTDVATVPRVTWSTKEVGASWIAYGVSGEEDRRTSDIEVVDGSRSTLLRGLPEQVAIDVRVLVDTGDKLLCSAVSTIQTGGLAAGLPEVQLDVPLPEQVESGFALLPMLAVENDRLAIVDTDGRYVWSVDAPEVRAAQFGLGGSVVVYLTGSSPPDLDGSIVEVGFDGVVQTEISVPWSRLSFTQIADGVYAVLVWDLRQVDGLDGYYLGDSVLIVDRWGNRDTLWSTFDDFEIDPDTTYKNETYAPLSYAYSWTHANWISYSEEDGVLSVVLANMDALVQLSYPSGELLGVVGGPDSDFVLPDPDLLCDIHSAIRLGPDRYLAFNRNLDTDECSEAIEFEFDRDTGTAHETWSYQGETCRDVYFLGQAERLSSGNTFTVFATAGQVEQATPDGLTAWQASATLGTGFGFSDFTSAL